MQPRAFVSADLSRSVAPSSDIAFSVDRTPVHTPVRTPARRTRWQRVAIVALRVALFAGALVALGHQFAGVNRDDVRRALRSYRWPQLTLAILCTSASFLTLGAIELVATRGAASDAMHTIPRRAALATGFLVHAFSQSIGFGLLTGAAVRLRAYARYGVGAHAVARTTTTVTASVMLALVSLVVVALLSSPATLRVHQIAMFGWAARVLAAAIVVSLVITIVIWRRTSSFRARWRIAPPPLKIAAGLASLSVIDWLVTGTVLATFVPVTSSMSYVEVLRAFFVANAIGAASQVPGGVGVLDVTLLSLLAPPVSPTTRGVLAAALVAYRITYYILPLCVALLVAALGELGRDRQTQNARMLTRSLPFHAHMPSGRSPGDVTHTETSSSAHASPAHRLEWLIDNADACDRVLDAIRGAHRSVWISQLAFDADCVIYTDDAAVSGTGAPPRNTETILAEALIGLAAASVDVRVLLNEHVLQNTLRPFRRHVTNALAARGLAANAIRLRGVRRFPHFLHMKMVIVDGTDAYLIGSPFVNGYWDDARHAPVDTRRPNRELSGRPLHDVSLRIRGRVVRQLESLYVDVWNDAAASAEADVHDGVHDDHRLRLTTAAGRRRAAADDTIRVVRTLPRRIVPNAPHGATEVLDALLDGLGNAREMIYIEHQYLTARPAVAAIIDALRRKRDLEVVIVVNQNPDLTAYRGWQNARLAESGLLAHPRVGVFTLWSAAPGHDRPGITALNQVFVHSKVVTIDDRWALVGAANLDGLSLHSYGDDFTGRGARRIFRHVRNFEVSLVINENGENIGDTVADLRTRLWSEHLALPTSAVARRPKDGWLALWRGRAANNVRTLSPGANPARVQPHMHGFVLPYSTRATPVRQLADIGVFVDRTRLRVQFDPGWLEAHLSPAWVRNIFA